MQETGPKWPSCLPTCKANTQINEPVQGQPNSLRNNSMSGGVHPGGRERLQQIGRDESADENCAQARGDPLNHYQFRSVRVPAAFSSRVPAARVKKCVY